jgi:hypothetical protein
MATSGRIDVFHAELQRRIAALVDQRLTIHSLSEYWRRVAARARISFDMSSRDFLVFAERKIGGRCPVFPLDAARADSYEDAAWAGWHEEWLCMNSKEYDLVGAGWTFFWGLSGRLAKEQEIFRAEWDETAHRGGVAPQPHWHLDTDIMVGYTRVPRARAPRPTGPAGLIELPLASQPAANEILPAEGCQELSLAGMHLGMGGWSNHSKHPEWWQCHVREDWGALADWAERTLRSTIDQFTELKVEDAVD